MIGGCPLIYMTISGLVQIEIPKNAPATVKAFEDRKNSPLYCIKRQ